MKQDINTPTEIFAVRGLYSLLCIGCFNKHKLQRRTHLQEGSRDSSQAWLGELQSFRDAFLAGLSPEGLKVLMFCGPEGA